MENIQDIISRLGIKELAEYRKEISGLLIAAAATFLFHQYIYSKNTSEIKRLDSQIQELTADVGRVSAEVTQTQKIAERLKEAMEKLKDMEERFAVTQSKLPSDKQLSSILKGLVGDDVKKGIKFISLKPLPLETKGEYFKLPFQITMQARFQSFGEYIERIEDMPRIVTVENFRIDVNEKAPSVAADTYSPLAIQLFMNTYVLGGE